MRFRGAKSLVRHKVRAPRQSAKVFRPKAEIKRGSAASGEKSLLSVTSRALGAVSLVTAATSKLGLKGLMIQALAPAFLARSSLSRRDSVVSINTGRLGHCPFKTSSICSPSMRGMLTSQITSENRHDLDREGPQDAVGCLENFVPAWSNT